MKNHVQATGHLGHSQTISFSKINLKLEIATKITE